MASGSSMSSPGAGTTLLVLERPWWTLKDKPNCGRELCLLRLIRDTALQRLERPAQIVRENDASEENQRYE